MWAHSSPGADAARIIVGSTARGDPGNRGKNYTCGHRSAQFLPDRNFAFTWGSPLGFVRCSERGPADPLRPWLLRQNCNRRGQAVLVESPGRGCCESATIAGVGAYFDWWDGSERRVLVLDGEQLTVGSAPDNDVVIDDPSVSRVHAILHQLNGRWFMEDCGSRNGTVVNGRRLTSTQPLRPADEVLLGRARLQFGGQTSPSGKPTEAVVERPAITAREHDVLVALCVPLAQRRRVHGTGDGP